MTDTQQRPASRARSREGSDNPGSAKKRRKDDGGDRSRVSRACDRCKRKKTRCSGRQPCILCTNAGLSCEFTAAYNRGRLPSVPLDDIVQSSSQGYSNQQIEPMGNLQPAKEVQIESRAHSSRNSPEPSQTDLQGHYVGPSSGVSFLLRVQKKLHQKVSFSQDSSIFTFGDAPLPDFNPSFFILPPKADAQRLVARYFDFAVPTNRFLHRPTVETWLEEFYENLGIMRQKEGARERTALLFMVFAQAKDYMPEDVSSNSADTSARYFQAAEHQLSSETGEIRLTSVQARLAQCFYLLSQSRVNHCWSLFGTTAHLMLAIGIHRKRRIETSNVVDFIDFECRKRVFWCAYSLDNYLSAALGRPRTFHDDDVDQDLPTCVNDSDLTVNRINMGNSKSQSIMMAPVAHTRISKIVSGILRDLYSIRPISSPARVKLAAEYSTQLQSWKQSLGRFLDNEGMDTSLLIPLFQRQRNVLNLAYYHAQILVHRPFLLGNFASLNSRNPRPRGAPGTPDMDRSVSDCLDAAMNIASIVNELAEGRQMFRVFWFTHYFAFCAVVVLYVYTIQQRNSPKERYISYFEAAANCQRQISFMVDKESLAQRYSVVLEELRLEALKQTQGHQDNNNGAFVGNPRTNNPMSLQAPMGLANDDDDVNSSSVSGFGFMDVTLPHPENMIGTDSQHGATPTSLMAELTGWGEFNSLVTAGMGGLDFLFTGENQTWAGNEMNDVGGLIISPTANEFSHQHP